MNTWVTLMKTAIEFVNWQTIKIKNLKHFFKQK